MAHLLLIDDDAVSVPEQVREAFPAPAHRVVVAESGSHGLEQVRRAAPDVVLLDIGLPKLNGYEAARRIRQQPWGRDILMIAVTGWGQEEDRRRSREAGFDHHLTKPVDPQELMKLLAGFRRS